jgi:hypothetical protein
MNLGELKLYLNYVLNKEQRGGALTPSRFNSLLKRCNLKHFKKKIGLPEEYRIGQPLSRQAFELTQKLSDDIRPFVISMDDFNGMLSVDSDGHSVIPSNMYYPSSLGYRYILNSATCGISEEMKPIEVLIDAQWNHRLASHIRPPSLAYPIAIFRDGYIEFRPKTLQFVNFTYVRYPVDPVYAYTLVNDVDVYDAANSIELEWDNVNILDIAYLILNEMGINLREGQIQQFSEMRKQEGQ